MGMPTDPQSESRREQRLNEAASREVAAPSGPAHSEPGPASESPAATPPPHRADSDPPVSDADQMTAGVTGPRPVPSPPGPLDGPPAASEPPSEFPSSLWSELNPPSHLGMEEPRGLASDSIPGYSIVREIHRGAQGVVYQAIQKAARRKVAIKVMREGPFASKHDRARFEREVQVLAALKHPHIVAVHESGVAAGHFYFVMDYISGQPLNEYIDAGSRGVRETLTLFRKICEAVNAAHLRGVIHRDLKPGNIRIDADGEPQVLDFGLAKVAVTAPAGESQVMSVTGQFIGSAPWASPEQAEGVPGKLDIRTDVYSLGVILYQMLTGKFPYDVTGGFREVLDRIMTAPPVRPSTVRTDIDDEVETIVLKSLAKDRERRYQSAGELARDIGRYLADEPIEAKRDSTWYIIRKRIRRYRATVAVAAGFVLMLTISLSVSLALWRQAAGERDRAVLAEAQATAARDGERRQRQLADQQRSIAQDRERVAQMAYAEAALKEGTALHLAGRGEESRAAFVRARDVLSGLGESTLPAEVGLYRSFREFEAPINTLTGHGEGLMAVAWLPDDIRACSASEDGTIRLWDTRVGQPLREPFRGHAGAVTCVAVSPDGGYLLSGGADGTVRLWSVESGEEVRPPSREPKGEVRGVAFSPDGRFVLSGAAERGGAVRLWDLSSGDLVRTFETPQEDAFYGVAFSPDGRRVLATTYEHSVWLWDAQTGGPPRELRGHSGYVISAAFSPEGDRVLSASYDHTLRLWDAQTGACVQSFHGHTAGVRGVVFVGGGERALSCSMDDSLKLWDLETGGAVRTFAGHRKGVRGVALSSDGRRAVSAGVDWSLKVWNLARNAEAPVIREAGTVTSLCCSSDGTIFVSGDKTGMVTLRDLATFRVLQTFTGHSRPIDTVAFLPDGRRLFAADSAGDYRLWDIPTGRVLHHYTGAGPGEFRNLRGGAWCFSSVSADGRFVVSSTPDATVTLRNLESGAVQLTLPAREHSITCVAVSPDSRYALCGDEGGKAHYWDLDSGECLFSTPVTSKPASVDCVVFSADGKTALTAGHELTIRLWDLTASPIRQVQEFSGPTLVVEGVGLGRGERILFSVGRDQTLRMWDVQAPSELILPAQFSENCYALAVVPPGDAVLAASGVSVTLWDRSRSPRHFDFAPRVDRARSDLRSDPTDAAALATLGEWYAFRGADDWAVELLEQARGGGADVSSLTLARCYWQLDRTADAAREFRSALTRNEAPADYLRLCLAAVTTGKTDPQPTDVPATGGEERVARASRR